MIVGIATVHLLIAGSQSLKEKRMVLEGLKDRLRSHYNISVAEVDGHEKWQKAVLGLAAIGTEKSFVNGVLDKALNLVRDHRGVEITDYDLELL